VKYLHIAAGICFVVAIAFYVSAFLPGAYGFGGAGMIFEMIAWICILAEDGKGKPNGNVE
jgi:hypothetical protein